MLMILDTTAMPVPASPFPVVEVNSPNVEETDTSTITEEFTITENPTVEQTIEQTTEQTIEQEILEVDNSAVVVETLETTVSEQVNTATQTQ